MTCTLSQFDFRFKTRSINFFVPVGEGEYCRCNQTLGLPAVHFLCMHSFHQRCLGDNERECPKCAQTNRNMLEVRTDLRLRFHFTNSSCDAKMFINVGTR